MTQQELLKLEDGEHNLTDGQQDYNLTKDSNDEGDMINMTMVHKNYSFVICCWLGRWSTNVSIGNMFITQDGLPTHFEDIKLKQ